MKIVLATFGSRGDVQPMLALSLALRSAGHDVLLAAPPEKAEWAELLDASHLWGLGVTPLEDLLKERYGKDIQICSIGPAGEMLSLTACIMNDKERAAGRSGLGAVMGSKRIKAVVVRAE
jgi:aldehyde:ferredoxin oxidoreductase